MTEISVAILSESGVQGGAEIMMLHLARGLRERGHRVHFIGPEMGSDWLEQEFGREDFQTHRFYLRHPVDPGCALRLAGLVRRHRFEVLHSHQFAMAVYGAAASRLSGAPLVVTMHGVGDQTRFLRRRLALRWALRSSDAWTAVSAALRDELRASLGNVCDRAEIIRNGVPSTAGIREKVRQELGIKKEELLVLAVGNYYHHKGHLLLLQAISRLPPSLPWRVSIAGRAEEAAPLLEAFIRAHGWEKRAHLLGPRADVTDLLAAADVFAMPSYVEGLPMALLEAMAAGLAIVATDVGGIPEAIRNGREGLLVPARDAQALASALSILLADGTRRRELGASAQTRATSVFSLDAMVDAYERVFQRVKSRHFDRVRSPAPR